MSGSAPSLRGYLQHVIDAIGRIEGYVATMGLAACRRDVKTQDAVIRNPQIIGEAALNIRQRFPDVVARTARCHSNLRTACATLRRTAISMPI